MIFPSDYLLFMPFIPVLFSSSHLVSLFVFDVYEKFPWNENTKEYSDWLSKVNENVIKSTNRMKWRTLTSDDDVVRFCITIYVSEWKTGKKEKHKKKRKKKNWRWRWKGFLFLWATLWLILFILFYIFEKSIIRIHTHFEMCKFHLPFHYNNSNVKNTLTSSKHLRSNIVSKTHTKM